MGRTSMLFRSAAIFAGAYLVSAVANAQTRAAILGNHPPAISRAWTAAPEGRQLQLTAVLALRNTADLAQLESDLQNRHSPNYHEWLTTDQFITRFGPTADQMAAVAA
jgi:subtilase family serine protease